MSYWTKVFRETISRASKALRIDSGGGIVTLLLLQSIIGGVLIWTTSPNSAGIPTRIATFAAPFLLLLPYFLWYLPSTISTIDRTRVDEIAALNRRIAELESESHSDISMFLRPDYTVHISTMVEKIAHSHNVQLENKGPNYLTHCLLRLSLANKLNLDLHSRAWLQNASAPFELRQGQVETLPVLWIEAQDVDAPAYLQRPQSSDLPFNPDTFSGTVLVADEQYLLFAEVLSANTPPSRLVMRVWNDRGWHIRELDPGENATI